MRTEIRSAVHNINSRDGYERIWGEGIPEISDAVKKMLKDWLEADEFGKIKLFFMGTCDYSEERSEYLIRELIRGNI